MKVEKTLRELATLLGARLQGDGGYIVRAVAGLEEAGDDGITFISSARQIKKIKDSQAGIIIVSAGEEGRDDLAGRNIIFVDNPYLAFASIIDIFRPAREILPGIDPQANIDPSAVLGKGVTIMPFAVIESKAVIGDNAVLYPGVYIGRGSRIGKDTTIYANVSVREGVSIGAGVIIHPNAVIGSDGFGYARDKNRYVKIPQRGSVEIEDDVEIGAGVTIDRATLGVTRVGRGTKIDNLVQIAHNVTIGQDAVIVSQVGISGSTDIGDRVQIGGQAGIVGHIKISNDAMVGAQSGVSQNIEEGKVFSGTPAIEHNRWLRAMSVVKKLPDMKKALTRIEDRLNNIEESGKKPRQEKP